MKNLSVTRMLLATALAFFSVTSKAGVTYTALDLGALTVATGLNDLGQVSGYVLNPSPGVPELGFTTGANGAGKTILGTLGGVSSQAFDINNSGRAVGWSNPAGAFPVSSYQRAFLTGTDSVTMADLGQLPTAGVAAATYAYAINNSGQVVGYSYINGYDHIRAFITDASGANMTALGSFMLWGGSIAYGINDTAQVVGDSDVQISIGQTCKHAFITGANAVGMTDMGTLGGCQSNATDINNKGQVVGHSLLSGNFIDHAYITGANGVGMTDLGTLMGGTGQSQALGIDNLGDVVGWSDLTGFGKRAFIDFAGSGMVDLNSLVVGPFADSLTQAVDINAKGQIIANGINGHAYLLTPTASTTDTTSVPEPATLALAGLGLLASGLARRKIAQKQ